MRILNKHRLKGFYKEMVYIGRPSKWGNPFVMNGENDRERVIAQYEQYLLNSPDLLAQIGELKDMDLVCWCAPRACHGDVLKKYVEKLIKEEGK